MADLNSCSFTGRLTRDAEQKVLPTGTILITFDMANNTGWGTSEKVLYLTVNLWGKTSQNILKYLTKGKMIAITGSLELQQWTSKHDGSTQKKNVINGNNVILLSSGSSEKQIINNDYDDVYSPEDEAVTF